MRGKTKIVKNASLLAIIASMFLASLLIQPGLAPTTTLTAPEIKDETKIIGSTFWLDIAITDAVNLWGYMFTLRYDTSVLTATDYTSHPIFSLEEPGAINDAEGYVSLAYHMPFGAPSGFYGNLPNLASIEFLVDDLGASQLVIEGSVLSDPVGNPVTHVNVAGSFRNILGVPMADFYWTPETPIAKETVTFTSTSTDDDAIVEWDWNFGDKHTGSGETTTHYYGKEGDYTVTLTVTDDEAKVDSFFDVITVLPKPGPKGAAILKTAATHHIVDYSQQGEKKTVLKAWIQNLNPLDKTTVRVIFKVYDAAGPQHLGSIVQIGLMGPTSKDLFAADFWFAEWSFTGPEMEYLIVVTCDYQDGWIGQQPNWVEVPEQGYITIHVTELAPVLVYSWTDLGGNTVLLDASASYDPDEHWGDYIAYVEWRVYDPDEVYYAQLFGATVTYTFAGPYSDVYCNVRIRDSFGAPAGPEGFYVSVTP